MLKQYNSSNLGALYKFLDERSILCDPELLKAVADIIEDVRRNGDDALRRFASEFDHVEVESFEVPPERITAAYRETDPALLHVMHMAAENIREYHKNQIRSGFVVTGDGEYMGQRVIPLRTVAIYAPGGANPYPSSLLMAAIPAKLAGVERVYVLTPPKTEGVSRAILAAAHIAGIDRVYTAGGAYAIAAAAYGTQSIPRADKIVGPGNVYSTVAKKLVYGDVGIDMINGPSDILVLADESASPAYIAADLISQAEHPNGSAILVSTSAALIRSVCDHIANQTAQQPNRAMIEENLKKYGAAVLAQSEEQAFEIVNRIAPEHLELMVRSPMACLDMVKTAGSVFLGDYSPEPVGDYFAGPNHILPTVGTARFSSPLGVDDFVRRSSFMYYSRRKLLAAGGDVIRFAESEGLTAHAAAVRIRMEE